MRSIGILSVVVALIVAFSTVGASASFDPALWQGHQPPAMPSAAQLAHTPKCGASFIPGNVAWSSWGDCVHGGGDGPLGARPCEVTPDPCDCKRE